MPVLVSKDLFENAKEKLQMAIEQYERNHENMVEVEKSAFNNLKSIQSELIELLKSNDANVFSDESYKRIVNRISAINVPQEITIKSVANTNKGSTVIEKNVKIALYHFIQSISRILDSSLKKYQEEKKSETPNNSEIEALKAKMKEFDARLQEANENAKNAYEEGIKYGKEKGKIEYQIELFRKISLLPENEQPKLLKLLTWENPSSQPQPPVLKDETTTNNKYSRADNSSDKFDSKSTHKIKTLEQDKEKAKEWIGSEKFKLVEELVESLESLSAAEQLLAKFLIFQLMLHKDSKTIKGIISDTYILMEKRRGILGKDFDGKFPLISNILKPYNNYIDKLEKKALTKKHLLVFYQLTCATGLYIPNDKLAANCFGTLYAQETKKNDKSIPVTTEENYIDSLVVNLQAQVQLHQSNVFDLNKNTTGDPNSSSYTPQQHQVNHI